MKYKSILLLHYFTTVLLDINHVSSFTVQNTLTKCSYSPIGNTNKAAGPITHLQMVATTPPSKYPTQRGSTVDSRKIVSQGMGKSNLKAIRLKHILFATKELATSSLHELRTAGLFFDDLAGQISNCVETREEGGEIGWVNVDGHSNEDAVVDDVGVVGVVGVVAGGGENSDSNEYLDLILPKDARDEVFTMSSKVRHSFSRYCVYFIDLIVQQLPYSFLFSLGIL
jgi:hypothetical protein